MTENLRIAREAAGLSQKDAAVRLGIAASDLSRWERGLRPVPPHRLNDLAQLYGVAPSFLSAETFLEGPIAGPLHHRSYKQMPAAIRKQIDARAMLHGHAIRRLLGGVEVDTPFVVPEYDVAPDDAATLVRSLWRLPNGPIHNLVETLERAGVVVVVESFGTDRVAGLSMLTGGRPVMVANADCPWDRIRFTLAHELGHMVLHRHFLDEYVEEEANQFAAAFLMPAQDIAPYFARTKQITVGYLLALKTQWGTAASALLRRARDLGRINEKQYSRLIRQMSGSGLLRREPNQVPAETPALVKEIAEQQKADLGSWSAVASVVEALSPQDIARTYAAQRMAAVN